jgi:hypothetical protein
MLARIRLAVIVGSLALGMWLSGCNTLMGAFDPDFLSSLSLPGAASQVANLPGDAPALLVAIENRTSLPVRAVLSFRTQNAGVESITYQVESGGRTAQALICPIEAITLGDVSDATAIGADVLLATGGAIAADAPIIEVEPFGVIMQNGVNYDCGDAITFAVQTSSATRSGFQIFAYIRRASSANP